MSETNKSIVEEALLSMKNLEEIISENAKGILASTMKQEIGELVKESLSGSKKRSLREEEEAPEEGDELPLEDEELEPADDEDDEMDAEMDAEMDFQEPIADKQELPALDMTQSPMSDVLKVFKLMGDDDGIIVQKDEKGDVHIKDQENEYIIVMDDINTTQTMNESYEDEENYGDEMDDVGPFNFNSLGSMGEFGEEETFEMYEQDEDEMGESVFEIDQEALESVIESFKYSKNPNMDKVSYKKKEGPKRYGKGGSAKKDIYPSKLKHGVSEMGDKEEEFEGWEQTEDSDLIFTDEDYGFETPEKSEASRTYGNGSKKGRGLRKGITPNRNMTYESVAREMDLLREKNEEYKKALGFFKNKINEVAVFNSNLAYSTRLFTEHSTTKQEKINILRRFDNVETIKESKNLYQSIKKELDGKGSENVVKESITERVIKTPQNGSATNLIETKTYENPQFMRMRDLMTKIK